MGVRNSSKLPTHKPKAVSSTWWGQRWIEALEHSSRDVVARLGKGRAYARDGHVHDLRIAAGQVQATVTDDELDSFAVVLKLEAFGDKVWEQVLELMGDQALYAAQLLNGEMPREIDRVFRACGKSLFPANSHEIDADCSCEDWSSPCKHVAATHYVLGDALDHDPFLLFELRGRSKEQVLSGLNHLRAHDTPAAAMEKPVARTHHCALRDLSAQHFEKAEHELPVFSFHFDAPVQTGALLRSLGKPASWQGAPPYELLGPIVAHARQLAVELAVGANQVKLQPASRAKRRRTKSSSS